MRARRIGKSLPQALLDRAQGLYRTHRNMQTVAKILHVNARALFEARRRGWKEGQPGAKARPMPDDFPLMANKLPMYALRAHYKAGQNTINRWSEICGRDYKVIKHDRTIRIPSGAKQYISEHGVLKSAEHYGVCRATIQKWKKKLALPFRKKRRKVATIGWAERYYEVHHDAR